MYLAVLSFQNTSCKLIIFTVKKMKIQLTYSIIVFYSYLPSAAITVYGVVNLILSLVSVAGLAVLVAVCNYTYFFFWKSCYS